MNIFLLNDDRKKSRTNLADQCFVETFTHSGSKTHVRESRMRGVGELILSQKSSPRHIMKYHTMSQLIGDIQESVNRTK